MSGFLCFEENDNGRRADCVCLRLHLRFLLSRPFPWRLWRCLCTAWPRARPGRRLGRRRRAVLGIAPVFWGACRPQPRPRPRRPPCRAPAGDCVLHQGVDVHQKSPVLTAPTSSTKMSGREMCVPSCSAPKKHGQPLARVTVRMSSAAAPLNCSVMLVPPDATPSCAAPQKLAVTTPTRRCWLASHRARTSTTRRCKASKLADGLECTVLLITFVNGN